MNLHSSCTAAFCTITVQWPCAHPLLHDWPCDPLVSNLTSQLLLATVIWSVDNRLVGIASLDVNNDELMTMQLGCRSCSQLGAPIGADARRNLRPPQVT